MTTPDHIWISPTVVDGLTGRIGTWIDRPEPQRQGYTRDDLTLTPKELATVREALATFAKIEVPFNHDKGAWVATTHYCSDMVTAHQVWQARTALAILEAKGPKP